MKRRSGPWNAAEGQRTRQMQRESEKLELVEVWRVWIWKKRRRWRKRLQKRGMKLRGWRRVTTNSFPLTRTAWVRTNSERMKNKPKADWIQIRELVNIMKAGDYFEGVYSLARGCEGWRLKTENRNRICLVLYSKNNSGMYWIETETESHRDLINLGMWKWKKWSGEQGGLTRIWLHNSAIETW